MKRPTEKDLLKNWEDYSLSDKFRHYRKRKRVYSDRELLNHKHKRPK